MVENQTSFIIRQFHSDGGGEYENNQLTAYFSQKGIVHEFTPLYAHKYNGITEQFNRTLQNMVRPWLADLNKGFSLNKHLWAEAYAAMVYTKNRLPHSSLQDMTPFEVFHCKKPSISHLQLFGRKCFVHIPQERCLPRSKLIPQAEEGILVGYTDTSSIYKVHIPARSHTFIVSALDITFENTSAIAEVTTSELTTLEVITGDVTMPDINSDNGLTSIISISFARTIIHSMVDPQ